MANKIGNVEAYDIICVNPVSSETTNFRLDKNFTINPNSTFTNVKNASQSITNLTTETYSDTILKTNVSVEESLNQTQPDYSIFTQTTFNTNFLRLPTSTADDLWGLGRLDVPTTFPLPSTDTSNKPKINGVRIYHSTEANAVTHNMYAAVFPEYSMNIAQQVIIYVFLFFKYKQSKTINNIKIYLMLDDVQYTLTLNLTINN